MKNWIWTGLTIILMSSCSNAKYSVGDCFDITLGTLEVTEVKDETYVLSFSAKAMFFVDTTIEKSIDFVEADMLKNDIVSYRCKK